MLIRVITRCCTLLSAGMLAAGVGCLLLRLGWPAPIGVGTALTAGVVFGIRGWKYLGLMYTTADTTLANTIWQGAKFVSRINAVFAMGVFGAVVAYAAVAVYLEADQRVARWLESFPKIADAVDPESWGVQFDWATDPTAMPLWLRFPPEKPGILGAMRYVVGIAGGVLVAQWLRWWLIPPEDAERQRRGRTLLSYAEAQRAARKARRWRDAGIFFGGLRLPSSAATSHWAVTGTTGSGKTITLRLLMQWVLPSIGLGRDHRAIVYDAKQDVVSYLHGMGLRGPIHILNPFDLRSVAWDIGRDCDSPAVAVQMASILIPEEEGANRFFPDAGRHILTGGMTSLTKTCPGMWDLRDLVLAMQDASVIRQLLERIPETRHLLQYFEEPRTLANIISTLATKMARFEPIAAAWSHAQSKVSLKDWIRGEFTLVLGNDERIRYPLDAINRVIFRRASELTLSQPESASRRTWVILDEVRQAGKLDGLPSLMTNGRSHGACVCLGFQDIEGLRAVYGDKVANELVGECSNKAVLRLESPQTAQWASELLGAYEEYEHPKSTTNNSQGKSETVNEQWVKRDTLLPSEFMGLPVTNRQNGLTGLYLSPYIGAYRTTLSGKLLDKLLKSRNIAVPDYVPRPVDQEYLAPWTDQDYQRLTLSRAPKPQTPSIVPQPSPKPALKVVTRAKQGP